MKVDFTGEELAQYNTELAFQIIKRDDVILNYYKHYIDCDSHLYDEDKEFQYYTRLNHLVILYYIERN